MARGSAGLQTVSFSMRFNSASPELDGVLQTNDGGVIGVATGKVFKAGFIDNSQVGSAIERHLRPHISLGGGKSLMSRAARRERTLMPA